MNLFSHTEPLEHLFDDGFRGVFAGQVAESVQRIIHADRNGIQPKAACGGIQCTGYGVPAGDLRIAVNVRPHPIFERDGYNVWVEMHISFPAAALGCELQVPTLDGKVKYNVPAGTQSGTVFKLKNRGIQSLNGRGHGDELVRVIVDVPRELTSEQKELMKQLDASFGNPANYGKEEEKKGFFGKRKK